MYLVFAGDQYYPKGGWDDLVGFHASLDDAKCSVEVVGSPAGREYKIDDKHYGWYQIVNARTLKVVEERGLSLSDATAGGRENIETLIDNIIEAMTGNTVYDEAVARKTLLGLLINMYIRGCNAIEYGVDHSVAMNMLLRATHDM